jgi:hypothetical protein
MRLVAADLKRSSVRDGKRNSACRLALSNAVWERTALFDGQMLSILCLQQLDESLSKSVVGFERRTWLFAESHLRRASVGGLARGRGGYYAGNGPWANRICWAFLERFYRSCDFARRRGFLETPKKATRFHALLRDRIVFAQIGEGPRSIT